MDKETRTRFELLAVQLEGLEARIRKLEAASGLAQRPDAELMIKVVHTRDEVGG